MIIFLDIDGVLATAESYFIDDSVFRYGLDKNCISAFNELIDKTQADVVISSSWRILHTVDQLKELFTRYGVKGKIVGVTPRLKPTHLSASANRGDEILRWIEENAYVGDYLVIDDEVSDIVGIIQDRNVIHVKDGWQNGGLKREHIGV